jgi:hypothetical protein
LISRLGGYFAPATAAPSLIAMTISYHKTCLISDRDNIVSSADLRDAMQRTPNDDRRWRILRRA